MDSIPNPWYSRMPRTLAELITMMDGDRIKKRRMKATSTYHSREWCNIITSETDTDVHVIYFK